MKRVAVIGGTGEMGRPLVQKLIGLGVHVRVLTRNRSKAFGMFGSRVEIIEGDLLQVKDLKALMEDATHLFAVHGAGGCPRKKEYELVHFGGLDKALDSIPATQETHIIYLSSLLNTGNNIPSATFNDQIYWTGLTERMVQKSGFPYTIVRTGVLCHDNTGDGKVETSWIKDNPQANVWEGMAEVLVQIMNRKASRGYTFEVCGQEAASIIIDWDRFFSKPKPEEDVLSLWF